MIFPTDELIFFRGVGGSTTNQMIMTLVIQARKDCQDLSLVSTKHLQKLHGGCSVTPIEMNPVLLHETVGFRNGDETCRDRNRTKKTCWEAMPTSKIKSCQPWINKPLGCLIGKVPFKYQIMTTGGIPPELINHGLLIRG